MSSPYSIGVDLGGTNLRIASYADASGLLDVIQLPTRLAAGRNAVVRDIAEAVEALVSRAMPGWELAGVGLGTPGPLELPEGVLRNPPNLPGWDGFDLRSALEERLGYGIEIESDANAAALAEAQLGAGRSHGIDSFSVLTLGTGVGNGLIFQGRIWHGFSGMGGEAGHVVIKDVDGPPCGCGGTGCLEQFASATGIVRMAKERMGNEAPVTSHEVYLAAVNGDERARSVFETVGHALAIALTGLINTLNLPAYLLGGGVCEAWELFAPTMFCELPSRSYVYRLTAPAELLPATLERHKTYILRAELGSTAGLLGACLLPFQRVPAKLKTTRELVVNE